MDVWWNPNKDHSQSKIHTSEVSRILRSAESTRAYIVFLCNTSSNTTVTIINLSIEKCKKLDRTRDVLEKNKDAQHKKIGQP